MPDSLLEIVVLYINENIKCFHEQLSFAREDQKQIAYCNVIDIIKIKVFFGVLRLDETKVIWQLNYLVLEVNKRYTCCHNEFDTFSFISRII